ncbi:MAG: hypothetical protein FI703_05030 [SAR202 cluster bacterium]|nr:hypothetical protein [SAR202 cluster bacterium]|tara:strand:+ start:1141 stop:1773 length:633 start_codon:yes stop_codon:yes gene_type:complete
MATETTAPGDIFPKMTVGVMGSAGGHLPPEICTMVYTLGQAIAEKGCVLITGACPGYPQEAVKGAKSKGGVVVGVSPALNMEGHILKYNSPTKGYDAIIYTGSGLMGREVENIRSCDVVVFVGGRSGTLGEFAIAYDEAKVIGVLEGTGGITSHLKTIIEMIDKETGGIVCYDSDPLHLLETLERSYMELIFPKYLKAMEGHDPDGAPDD